ncbi:cold-shock protein [Paenibacillus sedimenti]|uniref:Cold-shock protein n=1 Tax=Paenibacillus sedimenti TaxID=2770274 RepID=A0A926KS36_9BACL|nr:cold-shock protein [Paenibacillus sedimenti]MBD0382126.1 cold-shock protein [Paenibacillus sedimenti]
MYSRKKSLEEMPLENVTIWSCEQEGCKGWMRDNFAFEYVPTCHLCQSAMVRSTKLLPVVNNTNDQKTLKKGVQI